MKVLWQRAPKENLKEVQGEPPPCPSCLHGEQLSGLGPSSPENGPLHQIRLHPLLDQENLPAVDWSLSRLVVKDGRHWSMRATAAWEPQVPRPSHLFLATASKPVPFQGTLTQQPSSLELDLPQKEWLAHWAWPSQRLWGYFAWWWSSSSSRCEGAVSTSHSSFSFVCPVCSLSCNSSGSLGKVVGSGFDRRKTNKYCINMKKKKIQGEQCGTAKKGHYRCGYRNTTVGNILLKTQTGLFRKFQGHRLYW